MENKKRTMGEIYNDPNGMTNEEMKEWDGFSRTFKKLGKVVESYNFTIQVNNTEKILSKRFYQEHFIMSAVLEAFSEKDKITFKELNESIFNYMPNEFLDEVTTEYINLIVAKMIRFGFIVPIKTENEYVPNFDITHKGIEIYQDHTFQTLASSSFFSYQTYLLNEEAIKLNKSTYKISKLMLIAAIASACVAILSVIVTIWVTTK